ncbi:MAG: PfkB family carbohydrate kinase [Albidovulum sp.]|nr:PfkB family carbohydrate kinase [Albidovulum sp.]MDE0305162.1 PfkB family carbohydrate kinase [Albidovulum sp.]MDE0530249.1 PfkB family carbohydrate kinase [Albidovulum sp.]
MKSLAATGYASVDYVVGLAGRIAGDRTTLINRRDSNAWPRAGGCPAYVAMAAASAGQKAHAVCWVGDDEAGLGYRRELMSKCVGIEGIATMAGRASPTAVLAYQPDQSCACLFDPVFSGEETLNAPQRNILRHASHICITVGPPHLIREILDSRSDQSRLYWVLKHDLHAYPSDLRNAISGQADVIFCNASERDLIGRISGNTIIVQTRGENHIILQIGDHQSGMRISPLRAHDTTGAGDTLAGGFIAAEMAAIADPAQALRLGVQSARNLLERRMGRCAK